jgi:hypothetical protein
MLQAIEHEYAPALAMPQPVVAIAARYNGPPGMGNGGVTAGLLSRFFAGPVEVTLRRPVPLDRPLAIDEKPDHIGLWQDYALIASARPAAVDIAVPAPVSFEGAERASRASRLHHDHVYPYCFVCGTARGDGLGIVPGAVEGRDGDGIIAAPWTPRAEFAEGGVIAPEFVWGALDCPGGIAAVYDDPHRIVLGRIAAEVVAPVLAGERYVVIGWPVAREGRKRFAGTAIFSDGGDLVGRAISTWFDI